MKAREFLEAKIEYLMKPEPPPVRPDDDTIEKGKTAFAAGDVDAIVRLWENYPTFVYRTNASRASYVGFAVEFAKERDEAMHIVATTNGTEFDDHPFGFRIGRIGTSFLSVFSNRYKTVVLATITTDGNVQWKSKQ